MPTAAAGCKTPFTPYTEGVFFGLDEQVYRDAPGVCQTDLKSVAISPAHYQARITAPRKPSTPAQVLGKLTHAAILEDRVGGYVVRPDEFPDFKSKEARAWRDSQTLPIISKEDAAAIVVMERAVWEHPKARAVLSAQGDNEVSCFKQHEASGLLTKGRADRVATDANGLTVVIDLKTCEAEEGGRDTFTRDIFKWRYYRQAAYYLDLFGASFFVFIVVEKETPFAVAVYDMDPDAITLGRRENERDLAMIKLCQEQGAWPAYGNGMHTIGLPDWVMKREGLL